MADAPEMEGPNRLPGGGPSGKGPLVRAVRAKQPDLKKVANYWLNRFDSEKYSAQAELIELVMAVADVPSQTTVAKEDMKDQAPSSVVNELTSALALEASEKGGDFTQHWLVSRDKGATRTRENYPAIWRELASAPSPETLLKDVLPRLRAWTLALAECRFRSIRHCATVAGLGLVDGLQQQCNEIQGFCDTAERRLAETEVDTTRAQISKELKRQRQLLKNLLDARDSFAATLLSRRCKDVDADIRYSCIEALNRWAQLRGEASWKQYLHFAINDDEAKVRAAALLALQPLFRSDDGPLSTEVKSLAEDLRPRILERCHDIDASVSAAALRCACDLAKAEVLKEEDYGRITDLVWDPEALRRDAACVFVSRFILQEDIFDQPNGTADGSAAKRHLQMLLDFLVEFVKPHFELTERLVAALWRKASCLEDWDAMTSLLLGDGELAADQHLAIAFLAEATVRVAFDDWLANNTMEAEALLQRAARALCPRLPTLLSTFQSEKAAMLRTASLCNYLLRFCAQSPPGPTGGLLAGSAGEPVARALRSLFLRQTDLEALEHLALAWAHLLELCSGARPVLHDLVKSLYDTFLQLAPLVGKPSQGEIEAEVPMPDTLLATAQRLRILAKAYDVSLCDVEGFVSTALSVVDERVQTGTVEPELTVTLLELLALISVRHAGQLMQPPLPAVAADVRDEHQLQQASTAAEDLLELATGFLTKDEDHRLKSAAFGVALCTLSAWWNAAHFGKTEEVKPWFCQLPDALQDALANHLGKLLAEANQVPTESVLVSGMPEPGDLLKSSAFSHLFVLLQKGVASTESVPSDAERIKTARLCCLMVATCRHAQVAAGSLPSVVLSQARSRRKDLQQVAWTLLRRLRKEAHVGPTQAEDFFTTLLAAVKFLHKDQGTAIAKDLSFRLLQHVGVGKLTPPLQKALLNTLRRGVVNAAAGSAAGFLEALTPWITKHVVEDILIDNLASWAKEQSNQALQEAGLEKLLEACENTVKKLDPESPEKPSKRRRITKGGNRKTPTSTQEIKDAMELP